MSSLRVSLPASLLLLLTLTAASAPAASPNSPGGVRTFASLSEKERAELPGGTMVTVAGRTVALGDLRRAHLQRSAHFRSAPSAGAAALKAADSTPGVLVSSTDGKTQLVPAPPRELPPGKFLIEPPSEYADNALDKQTFCNAARAAVCLYYPASTWLFRGGDHALDIDPYITDTAVCTSQGGTMYMGAWCQYAYDVSYHVQFNPGAGFTYKAKCDPEYWTITAIDKHGAILVDSKKAPGAEFTTGASPPTCVIRVWLPQ